MRDLQILRGMTFEKDAPPCSAGFHPAGLAKGESDHAAGFQEISWSETAAVNTLGFEVQMGAS